MLTTFSPRLAPEFYQGYAHVLWTYIVKDSRTGWLNEHFLYRFRETLLHICACYHLSCAKRSARGGALSDACDYLRRNPLRAGLVTDEQDWVYAGSLVPGFPNLDPWDFNAFRRCYTAYRRSLEGA